MSRLWYLSFADDSHGGFLGGCIVRGEDIVEAALNAHRMKINPGGEVCGWDVTGMQIPYPINTLMTREQMAAIDGADGKSFPEMTPEELESMTSQSEIIVQECNSPLASKPGL